MLYPRLIFKDIKDQIDAPEIIIITGMRRVGKTTLLRMLYSDIKSKNKVFLDFENIVDRKIFNEVDYNNIWFNLKPFGIIKEEKAYIFIDEIQNKPEIISVVKYLYDHYDVKFFLTGSCSYYIKDIFPESLAGRKIIYELFPLNFEEFLLFKKKKKEFVSEFKIKENNKNLIVHEKFIKLYEEFLFYGGFPQVVLTDNEDRKIIYLKDILNSYIEIDVRKIVDFRKISIFSDLIFLLMQRTGSKLDISRISNEIGVSRSTVYSYISFLEKTYFIFLISPFNRNIDKEVRGTKKVYFCDNGILNYFSRISEGSLFENAVFNCLKPYGKVNYYQNRSGAEIDFIIHEKDLALEVKKRGLQRDYRKLSKISKSIGISNYYIISQTYSEEKGIIAVTDI